jgi:hypothetical protein
MTGCSGKGCPVIALCDVEAAELAVGKAEIGQDVGMGTKGTLGRLQRLDRLCIIAIVDHRHGSQIFAVAKAARREHQCASLHTSCRDRRCGGHPV